jgi:molybdopterin-guanine dinucleotide biosynthesis protein A
VQVDAVVLAGGLNSDSLRASCGYEKEALITIGNRPMVEYVVNALKHTPQVGRIVVAGHRDDLTSIFGSDPSLIISDSGPSSVATLQKGLETLQAKTPDHSQTQRMVIVTTGDIPMITPEAIDDFLHLCQKRKGDLYYPVVTRENSECKYPGVIRTYVRLREGQFTGGNLILVDPAIVAQCSAMADRIVQRRKNPLALCKLLGWRFVMKFLFRTLNLAEVEDKVSNMMGIKGVAVISSYAEVGVDVDKPGDLQLVRRILEVC